MSCSDVSIACGRRSWCGWCVIWAPARTYFALTFQAVVAAAEVEEEAISNMLQRQLAGVFREKQVSGSGRRMCNARERLPGRRNSSARTCIC